MADPFARTDPAATGSSATTVRVSGQGHEHEIDYQAELEKLRADMSKLAQTVSGSVRQKMQPVARELESAIARNPTASVAIAAGVGLLLGFMMSRR